MLKKPSRQLDRLLVSVILAATGAGLTGCGSEPDGQATAPDVEAAVPDVRGEEDLDDVYSGKFDAAFVEDLPAYARQEVTVLAEVAEVVSDRAFTVTSPDGSEVEPVLAVATAGAVDEQPQTGDELVLAATPVDEFDAASVVAELGLQIDPGLLEAWDGETYLSVTIAEPAP